MLNSSIMAKAQVLIGLFLIFFTSKAQLPSDLPPNSAPFNFSGMQVATFDHRYDGVKGYHTFVKDFVRGVIEMKKDQRYENVLINYDAVADNLIAKSDKIDGAVLVRKDLVLAFVLKTGEEEYVFEKKVIKGMPTFLLKLSGEKEIFYCRITKSIKEINLGGPYNTSQGFSDEFKEVLTYYYELEDGSLQEIPANKRGIIRTFPQLEKELTQYFKSNKIDFNSIQQAQLLFIFISERLK